MKMKSLISAMVIAGASLMATNAMAQDIEAQSSQAGGVVIRQISPEAILNGAQLPDLKVANCIAGKSQYRIESKKNYNATWGGASFSSTDAVSIEKGHSGGITWKIKAGSNNENAAYAKAKVAIVYYNHDDAKSIEFKNFLNQEFGQVSFGSGNGWYQIATLKVGNVPKECETNNQPLFATRGTVVDVKKIG